jgi:hypothetical protein
MQLGWPYPKRKSHLDKLVASPSDRTHGVPFQDQTTYLRIYSVPIDLPKYRLNNGRTYAAQAEYLATHPEVSSDFFTADLELDAAQHVQHTLLSKLADDKELLTYFKTHEQEEPLILTSDGFVLNGNRRLCAMRKLFESDKEQFSHFAHIDIVVLPPADEKDLDSLEAKLQIHPDIKADYTWISRALMLKRRRDDHGFSEDELANLYEMKKGEVSELIDMLADADIYLEDRNKEGQYHLIDETFYAFQQLGKNRAKLKSEGAKSVYDKIAYCLIDESAEGGRLYDLIPAAGRYLPQVIESVREEWQLQEKETQAGDVALLGGEKTKFGDVLEVLDEEDKRGKIREIVRDIVTAEELKEKEKKRKNFVLSQIRKANTALVDAFNAITGETEKAGIAAQLKSIQEVLQKIKSWVDADPKN